MTAGKLGWVETRRVCAAVAAAGAALALMASAAGAAPPAVASGKGVGESPAEDATTRPVVLGYYPTWPSGLTPETIDYRQFTHLCHAFATADSSGTLKVEGNMPSRELTRRAREAGVKTLVSLGGMDSNLYFGPMSRDPAAVDRFVRDVAALVVDNGYDGIDLDWEFPKGEEEMHAFTALARRFRETLEPRVPGVLITAALSGSAWAGRWVDGPALLDAMDFVCVMTYDAHGPWSDHAGFNSPLEFDPDDRAECRGATVAGQMAFWTDVKKWPKNRLVVGIPCYGRGFRVTQWFQATPRGAEKPRYPYLPFREVAGLMNQGWRSQWNEAAQAPWLSKDGVNELISYDDERSAAAKGRWAAENGYAGVFFWEISQDFIDGRHALAAAAAEAFAAAVKP